MPPSCVAHGQTAVQLVTLTAKLGSVLELVRALVHDALIKGALNCHTIIKIADIAECDRVCVQTPANT